MTIIKTRNSSTASAVPTAGNLVQGELAVNVADKRLFTEDNAAQIIEIGTNPTSITTGAITASGTVTANGQFVNGNALLTGGSINNIIIGNSTASAVTGTVVTASTGFVGGLTGNVTGNLTGNTTGNVTGNVTGDLTGNVTAASGTTSLHNLSLTGTVDFNTARLTDIGTPTAATDAVTKAYADGLITNLIDGAPAALDTLNELAAAMADDASFHTTVTNSIATKLPLAGGTMTGAINMGAAKISNLATPTSAQDAATKAYADAQASGGLPTSGGTMTGAIAMSTNKITGMGDPTAAQDATTKTYVDGILGSATSAATSAAAALVSQNAAATSAATATTQAGISTTKAGEASTSATSAAASFDSFDDRYLGAKASDPSVDNDGDALVTGALVFNTTSATMKVYGGSSWSAVAPTATSVTLSQVTDFPTQSGQSGKYLTTNGSVPSWGVLSTDSTLATLTKTFTAGETSTITLTANAVAPVVAVTKEVAQTGVTNNAWDAAASTYTFENSAPATTLDFSNYDISSAAYSSKSYGTPSEATPQGVAFKSDGTKMYVTGHQDSHVHQYSLSTAFDVSTASYNNVNVNIYSKDTQPTDVTFKTDGLEMYVVGNQNGNTYQYTLTTAWDLSSASYTRTLTSSSQDNDPNGIRFNTGGTRMFIMGNTNNAVLEYELSTAWDISSASYTDMFSVSSQTTQCRSVDFNNTGTKMFVLASDTDSIFQYNLTTAFDVSTSSYANVTVSVSSEDNNPRGLCFNNNGTKFYIMGDQNNKVFEYDITGSTLSLGSGSFAAADVGKTIYANSGSVVLTSTGGAFTIVTALSSTNQVASGNWTMFGAVYDSTADVIKPSGVAGAAYDITVASYTGDTLSANVLQGMRFNNDGTKMFTLQYTSGIGNVNEYTLSTAYLVSSATYVSGYSVLSQDALPKDFAFNSDGTKMYMLGNNTDNIFLYNLSTAFTISTASYANVSANINASGNIPVGMEWSPDGTRLYIANAQYGYIVEHPVSTAFDISTIQVYSNSISSGTGVTGVVISTDGTKIFATNGSGGQVYAWTLTTPFNASTAVYIGAFDISPQASTNASGLMFNADGSDMYVCSSVSGIWQYSTQSVTTATGYQPAIASTIDSTYWTDINSLTATNVVGSGNVFYAISADAKTSWNILDNSSGVRKIVKNNSGTYQVNTNSTYGSETWANAATNTEVAALRQAMESAPSLSGTYNISTAVYSQSFSTASQETQPQGLAFNNDGTKMYVSGYSSRAINEYALSTAYDVSTASFTTAFSTASQSIYPTGIAFKADGTIMYVSEAYGSTVLQYALSTAFDVSSASYTHNFTIYPIEGNSHGVAINTNGTKMFVIGTSSDAVNEFALSTAFDVTSASFTTAFSISGQDGNSQDLFFNSDGTRMWVIGTGLVVYAYTLTTGFDVSTASYDSVNFSVSSKDNDTNALAFNSNGSKMYVLGEQNDSVYTYSVGITTQRNQMTSTQLNAINDASQITLGSALDFATILYYASGSTIPTYSGTAINYDANVLNNGAVLGTDYTFDAPAQNKVRITSVNAANLKIRVV